MKKQLLTLTLIAGIAITSFAQSKGTNHYQSLNLNTLEHKTGNKLLLALSAQFTANYLLEYDLSDDSYKLLNDSIKAYRYAPMNGDTGVGHGSSPSSYAYYTHDNWKTYKQTTSSAGVGIKKIIKTSTGFLGYKQGLSSNGIVISHSADGVTWAASTPDILIGSIPYHYMEEIDGKTFFISGISNNVEYRVSYDGGKTFTNQTMIAPTNNGQLRDIKAFDSIKMLADIGGYQFSYTINGGKNWSLSPSYSLTDKKYLYASSLDSIYFSKKSGIDSIFLSTDTGKTFAFYSKNLPKGDIYSSIITNLGDYIIVSSTKGEYYAKNINAPWKPFYQKILGTDALDFKGNTGIVAGKLGVAVTYNDGHYFNVLSETFSESISAAKVMSDTVMFLGDAKGNAFRTGDGGLTWSHVGTGSNTFKISARDFYASSTGDTMLMTRGGSNHLASLDRGVSFYNLFSGFGIGGDYDGCLTPNGKAYYVIGKYIDEVKLSNGNRTGINTLTSNTGTKYSFGLKMYDNNLGYIWAWDSANELFNFYKTSNAWVNYTELGEVTGFKYKYGFKPVVHLVTADTLYAHQNDGTTAANLLFHSYDGGVTWGHDTIENFRYYQSELLQDIHFFDGKTFIACFGTTLYLNRVTGTGGTGGGSSIESIPLENTLKLYPNPTTNILNIDFNSTINQIAIYDLSGKEIVTKNILDTPSIDVSNLQAGTYLIRVMAENKAYSQIFVKQ